MMTGDSIPRVSAWNLAHGNGWKPDSRKQWIEALAVANPDPVNTNSAHLYTPKNDRFGDSGYGLKNTTLTEMIELLAASARTSGKPLWLGEFGPQLGEKDPACRREQVSEFLRLIEAHHVGLSAYWVYDCSNPNVAVWNATPDNDNSFVFEMIAEANRRLALSAKE